MKYLMPIYLKTSGWYVFRKVGLMGDATGADGVGFCFYQSGMMFLRQYKVFSVDSCFINKQMEITNERI